MFGSGQFSTGPIYVTGFSWRAAPGLGPLSVGVTANVYVSTSPTYPNTTGHPLLSTTFANNVGPDKTLVLSGSAAINGAACAGPAPCPWANSIAFTTPFYYNPANGPLLIDIQLTSFTATSGQYDVGDCNTSTCVTVKVYTSPIGTPTAKGRLRRDHYPNHVHPGEHRALRDLQLHRDSFHRVPRTAQRITRRIISSRRLLLHAPPRRQLN